MDDSNDCGGGPSLLVVKCVCVNNKYMCTPGNIFT